MTALSAQRRKLLEQLLKEKGVQSAPPPALAISRRHDSAPIPLALNQEGLWFIEQLDPGKAHYNIPGAVRVQGKLNIAALEHSLSEIVRRHDTLRTTFALQADGTPCQIVALPAGVQLPLSDLRGLPAAQREIEAKRLATAEAHRAFDLAKGPLFRTQLLRLDVEEYVLILNVHHLVADGWSLGIFTSEWRAFYEAFVNNTSAHLATLSRQYADFAVWQRQQMAEKNFQAQLAYWRQQLGGPLPVLQLPTDKPRPQTQSFRGGHEGFKFSPALTAALRKLARHEETTVYITLLAAFNVLLYSYTGQKELIVGSTFANRNRSEWQELIGFFVNTLPLRNKFSSDLSFREWLQRVRQTALAAAAHQELPLAKLVQELQPERDPSRNPFYQVVFDLLTPDHNPAVYGYGMLAGPVETVEFSGLRITPVDFEYNISRFDLAVFIWDLPEGFAGVCEYGADLFEPATISRLVQNFEILLNHIVADPAASVQTLIARLDREDRQNRLAAKQSYQETMHQKLKQSKRRPIIHEN
ncbi:MAG: Linear gramicidin synthase subunit B [bacterium]|nr:Linear gramicidin synthase subunit B [bacterium]